LTELVLLVTLTENKKKTLNIAIKIIFNDFLSILFSNDFGEKTSLLTARFNKNVPM